MKEEKKSNKLAIIIKGFDIRVIDDNVVRTIVEKIMSLGIEFSGPTPIPTRRKKITVLKSPHKHKKAQETFVRSIHKRIIKIWGTNNKKIENEKLENLRNTVIATNVSITLKDVS